MTAVAWSLASCLSSAALSDLDLGGTALVADRANLPVVAGGLAPLADTNTWATLTLQLQRGDHTPLVGAEVRLVAEGAHLSQPGSATDALGRVVGQVACSAPGQLQVGAELHQSGVSLPLTPQVTLTCYAPADAGAPASITGSQPLSAAAHSYTVAGGVDTRARGELHVRASDAAAILPPPYRLQPGDNGVHAWPHAVLLRTPGPQVVQVIDDDSGEMLSEEHFFVVAAGAAAVAADISPARLVAGQAAALTLSTRDARGLLADGFTGSLRLHTSDPAAQIAAVVAFTADDRGQRSLPLILQTPGTHSLTVTDTAGQLAPAELVDIDVAAGPPAALRLQLPDQVVAGSALVAQLTVVDGGGHPTSGLMGAAAWASSDASASLPPPAPIAVVAGVQSQTLPLTFRTPGVQRLHVACGPAPGLTLAANVAVAAAIPARLRVVAPVGCTAGVPFDITLAAVLADGSPCITYAGTVALTAIDPSATLPSATTFGAAHQGQVRLPAAAVLRQAGAQVLHAADLITASLVGDSGIIAVHSAPAASLHLATSTPVVSNIPFDLTLSAQDAFGNRALDYVGNVTLASNNSTATLPAGAALPAAAQGQLTLNGAGRVGQAGTSAITLSDAAGLLPSVQLPLLTVPGAPTGFFVFPVGFLGYSFCLANSPGLVLRVRLLDSFGNPASNFVGAVTIDSGGAPVAYPARLNFGPGNDGQAHGEANGSLAAPTPSRTLLLAQVAGVGPPSVQTIMQALTLQNTPNPFANDLNGGGITQSTAQKCFTPSLVLDANDAPHVAWNDQRNGSQVYFMSWAPAAGSWRGLGTSAAGGGVSSSSGSNDQVSLALDPVSHAPLVAWRHADPSGIGAIWVRAWSAGAGAWQPLGTSDAAGGIDGQTGFQQAAPALIVASGQPTVAWQRTFAAGTWQICVLAYTGGAWQPLGASATISAAGANHTAPSLAVDAGGSIWLAWQTDAPGRAQIYLRRFVAGVWGPVAGSDTGLGVSYSLGAATAPSLAVDGGGTPWLAWLDTGFDLSLRAGGRRQVRVACFDGSGWSCPDGGSAPAGISRSLTDARAVGLAAGAAGDVVALWTHREPNNNLSCLYLRRLQAGVWREVAGSASALGIGFPAITRSQGPLWPRLALKSGNAEVVMAWANDNANSSNFQICVMPWQ